MSIFNLFSSRQNFKQARKKRRFPHINILFWLVMRVWEMKKNNSNNNNRIILFASHQRVSHTKALISELKTSYTSHAKHKHTHTRQHLSLSVCVCPNVRKFQQFCMFNSFINIYIEGKHFSFSVFSSSLTDTFYFILV